MLTNGICTNENLSKKITHIKFSETLRDKLQTKSLLEDDLILIEKKKNYNLDFVVPWIIKQK